MEININRYDEFLKVKSQKETLIREMKCRVKNGTDWISFDALKTIFDLWDDVPEVKHQDDENV